VIDINATDEFKEWFDGLNEQDTEAVIYSVDLLEQKGLTLSFPHSSGLSNTRYPLRELRVQSGGRPLRIIYAFDPKRHALLILGGDKTGDGRFYETMIPRAEKLWEAYLAETKER
jgi:hypothetical protein